MSTFYTTFLSPVSYIACSGLNETYVDKCYVKTTKKVCTEHLQIKSPLNFTW